MGRFDNIPCDKIILFLQKVGYKRSSLIIDGVSRWDKDKKSVILHCSEYATESVVSYVLKTVNGQNFELFMNILDEK